LDPTLVARTAGWLTLGLRLALQQREQLLTGRTHGRRPQLAEAHTRARGEEPPRHLASTRAAGGGERRLLVARPRVHLAAVREQHVDRRQVADRGRVPQREPVAVPAPVHVGAAREGRLHSPGTLRGPGQPPRGPHLRPASTPRGVGACAPSRTSCSSPAAPTRPGTARSRSAAPAWLAASACISAD